MNQPSVSSYDEARQAFIQYALKIGAIELVPGGRRLKSGRMSPYFFNSGLFNTGETMSELVRAYAIYAQGFASEAEVVFGPAYKGIPLAVALALVYGDGVGFAFNRKEEKTHGDGGTIVGASLAGKKVVVVDDVMTTGTSSSEAVEIVRAHGGTVIACVIAFDRQERGNESELSAVQEFEQKYNIPVYAVATLNGLISVLKNTPAESGDDAVGEILEEIIEYQDRYGCT